MGGYGSDYSYDTDESTLKKSADSYNIDSGRTYEVKAALPAPIGKHLITEARFPIVIATDVTGSMKEWPRIIFEKLCILYNEVLFFLPEILKESFEISFAAIGDAYCDQYSIQITDFAAGNELDENIKALYPEGGGGPDIKESYELTAYFYLNHCDMPNALEHPKPLMVFIGDESYYDEIDESQVKRLIDDDLKKSDNTAKKVFDKLLQKFNIYILRVKYSDEDSEKKIRQKWQYVLGENNVILMKEPRRIVDTILGLIATAVDEFDKFKERIEIRQTPEQVKQVYLALNGVQTDTKKFVYKFKALICPVCGGPLKEKPKPNKPVECPSCQKLIVEI